MLHQIVVSLLTEFCKSLSHDVSCWWKVILHTGSDIDAIDSLFPLTHMQKTFAQLSANTRACVCSYHLPAGEFRMSSSLLSPTTLANVCSTQVTVFYFWLIMVRAVWLTEEKERDCLTLLKVHVIVNIVRISSVIEIH